MIKSLLLIFATLPVSAQYLLSADSAMILGEHSRATMSGPLPLKFYSAYISSADGSTCTFSPTCSGFSKRAVKKHGLLIGLLLSVDRICRCNGHNEEFYEPSASGALSDRP